MIQISLDRLAGREIVPSRPSVSGWPGHACQESQHTLRHTISLGELRANHLHFAASDAIDLSELFGVIVDRGVMRSWKRSFSIAPSTRKSPLASGLCSGGASPLHPPWPTLTRSYRGNEGRF